MKTKRYLTAALALMMIMPLAFVLAACGGNNNETTVKLFNGEFIQGTSPSDDTFVEGSLAAEPSTLPSIIEGIIGSGTLVVTDTAMTLKHTTGTKSTQITFDNISEGTDIRSGIISNTSKTALKELFLNVTVTIEDIQIKQDKYDEYTTTIITFNCTGGQFMLNYYYVTA